MTHAAEPLPRTPAEITPDWLAARLREAGVLPAGAAIGRIAFAPVELGGVNGDVFRLLPSYDGAHGPASVIAKFPASAPAARGVARFQRWYEREVRAYGELNAPGTLPMPRCFFATRDPDDAFVLLLEDLGRRDAGDQLAGCDQARAETVIRTIARVHARWWNATALDDELTWLPLTTVGLDHARPVQGAFARSWEMARPGLTAPPGFARIADRAVEHYPDLLAEAASPPLTVIHGDYRLDNMFFDRVDDRPRVTVIDWQFTARCRGAYDVAYFIGLDFDGDDRRLHEDELLSAYLDALRTAGVTDYDAAALRRDYALGLRLAFATFVIGAAGRHSAERARALHRVGLERLAAAIVDTEPGAPH